MRYQSELKRFKIFTTNSRKLSQTSNFIFSMFPDEVRNGKDILTSEVSVPEDLKPPIKNNCTIKFSEVVAAF